MTRLDIGDFKIDGQPASAKAISNYLDDMAAGLAAGPVGTPEFRQAVHDSQERRKSGLPLQGDQL